MIYKIEKEKIFFQCYGSTDKLLHHFLKHLCINGPASNPRPENLSFANLALSKLFMVCKSNV